MVDHLFLCAERDTARWRDVPPDREGCGARPPQGATVVEAYPVAPDSPSYRFCGFVPVLAAHGPVKVGRAGLCGYVMRRELP